MLPSDYHALAQASMGEGEYEEAIAHYEKALIIDPHFLKALNNIGVLLKLRGRFDEAKSYYFQALSLKPDFAEAHNNLGNIFLIESDFSEALRHFLEAVKIKHDYTDAHNSLGLVYDGLGQLDEAYASYARALSLDPDNATTLTNLGNVFARAGFKTKALQFYTRAIRIAPYLSIAYYNKGNVFREQGFLNRARLSYRKAIKYNSEFDEVYSSLYHVTRELCRFNDLPLLERKLDEIGKMPAGENKRPAESPIVNTMRLDDQQINLANARSWSTFLDIFAAGDRRLFALSDPQSHKKLRIGYLVGGTHSSEIDRVVQSLLVNHDQRHYEVVYYSYVKNNPVNSISLFKLSPGQATERIYDDEIDILIDLNGYEEGGRLELLAYRPAPIQVVFQGYSGTTGASFIDYAIVDEVVAPRSQEKFYTEKLVYMPSCYRINAFDPMTTNSIFSRVNGLPKAAFVFASLAKSSLIDPVIFEVWVQILLDTPRSVLVLERSNAFMEKNLKKEAIRLGLDPGRLIFVNVPTQAERTGVLAAADLILDTQLSHGEGTSSAIWAEVPVVTMYGEAFQSRVSASLLSAVGCSQLITHSIHEYRILAGALARNKPALDLLRLKIHKQKEISPLFDTERFVVNLEGAFQQMWTLYKEGKKPEQLIVKDLYLLQ